jgi:hypothetical protein
MIPTHFIDRASDQEISVGDIGETIATFCLIHVMGGDQDRQALSSKILNFFPEIASRFWVDASCRLVEQKKFWFMD